MNKQEIEEINELRKAPEFQALEIELVQLQFYVQRELVVTTKSPIMAHELKEGKPMELVCVVNPGQDRQKVAVKIEAVRRQAEHLAREMSRYFPEHRRWHWQEVFLRQVFGANRVVQRQRGGRSVETDYKAIAGGIKAEGTKMAYEEAFLRWLESENIKERPIPYDARDRFGKAMRREGVYYRKLL